MVDDETPGILPLGNNPSSPCAALDSPSLQRELAFTPAVEQFTPMRRLACWPTTSLAGHALVLISTKLAISLAAVNARAECSGIGCVLDAALHKANEGDTVLRSEVCLPELLPLINTREF